MPETLTLAYGLPVFYTAGSRNLRATLGAGETVEVEPMGDRPGWVEIQARGKTYRASVRDLEMARPE